MWLSNNPIVCITIALIQIEGHYNKPKPPNGP